MARGRPPKGNEDAACSGSVPRGAALSGCGVAFSHSRRLRRPPVAPGGANGLIAEAASSSERQLRKHPMLNMFNFSLCGFLPIVN
jgi:hypothetical protein